MILLWPPLLWPETSLGDMMAVVAGDVVGPEIAGSNGGDISPTAALDDEPV